MAHELEINANGIANTFSVLETPWHRLGHILLEAPTFDEALAIAGHNFEVEKRPTYRAVNGGTDYIENKLAFVTVRTDTGAELGSVGPHYTPVQNADAFEVLRPLVDSGLATLETGGTLRGGADTWLLVKFDLTKFGPMAQKVFGTEVVPYATVSCNHSGRRGVLVALTPIRIECANTLSLTEQVADQQLSVAHYKGAQVRLVTAAENLFGSIVQMSEVAAGQFQKLKERVLTAAEFEQAILDVIAPRPTNNPRFNPESRMAEAVLERAERKREVLTSLWTGGKGHTGDHSAWEAWQGAVEAIDHRTDLFPTRSGVYRTAALLDGQLRQSKTAALKACLAIA